MKGCRVKPITHIYKMLMSIIVHIVLLSVTIFILKCRFAKELISVKLVRIKGVYPNHKKAVCELIFRLLREVDDAINKGQFFSTFSCK